MVKYIWLQIQSYKVYIIKIKIKIIDQRLQSLNLDMCVRLIKVDGVIVKELATSTDQKLHKLESILQWICRWLIATYSLHWLPYVAPHDLNITLLYGR